MDDLLPTAILIPSLNRPQNLERVWRDIRLGTDEEHTILWCVSDDASKEVLTSLGEWFLDDSDTDDRRYVTRMNKLIRHVGEAKTIFFGSDDVIYHPGWLRAALRVMANGPEVVVVNDLRNPNGTQALIKTSYLDRAVFDAPGEAFHPGYHHNFADTEQFYTAARRGVIARAMQSYVEHLHPIFNDFRHAPWDKTYEDAASSFTKDQERFQARIAAIDRVLG